ncbi:MAG: METTL5 family protein [Zestosphaera sp.]
MHSNKCTSKKELEILLSKVPDFRNPKEGLEQYVTPADIAAELAWDAFMRDDLEGRVVHDMGCGTGRLALAASMLNAKYVVCSDVDLDALEIAREVLTTMSSTLHDVVLADLREAPPFRASDCVVMMNPPFGVKSRKADTDFLTASLKVCGTTYSLHKLSEGLKDALKRLSTTLGFNYEVLKTFKFPLRASLPKHRRKVLQVDSVMIRSVKGSNTFKDAERE